MRIMFPPPPPPPPTFPLTYSKHSMSYFRSEFEEVRHRRFKFKEDWNKTTLNEPGRHKLERQKKSHPWTKPTKQGLCFAPNASQEGNLRLFSSETGRIFFFFAVCFNPFTDQQGLDFFTELCWNV